VRETLGEDTCDARRSLSDPGTPGAADVDRRPPRPGPAGPCSFDKGIASLYPQYKYRVSGGMHIDQQPDQGDNLRASRGLVQQ
jgi:hypothetical protein